MCDFIPEFKDGSILGNLINLMQDTIRSKYTNYLTISRDIENSLWQDSTPLKKKKTLEEIGTKGILMWWVYI